MRSKSNVLPNMVEFSDEIESDILSYGSDIDSFLEEKRFQRSSKFCLFQIGKMVKLLRPNYGESIRLPIGRK